METSTVRAGSATWDFVGALARLVGYTFAVLVVAVLWLCGCWSPRWRGTISGPHVGGPAVTGFRKAAGDTVRTTFVWLRAISGWYVGLLTSRTSRLGKVLVLAAGVVVVVGVAWLAFKGYGSVNEWWSEATAPVPQPTEVVPPTDTAVNP